MRQLCFPHLSNLVSFAYHLIIYDALFGRMIDHQPLSERDHSQLPDVARTRMRIQGHTGGKPLDPMNCIP